MKVQVYRTGASSYQDSNFIKSEQATLEQINGVKYINSLKETIKDTPFILITNTHTNVNEIPEIILNKTALMIHPNSGHDNLGADFIQKASFPIVVGNPIRSNAVAEYTLSCLFKELTPIPNHTHWQHDRSWSRKLLRDQKVLIIGHGHIGKILNQSLSPLVKELKVYDPFIQENLPVNIIQDFDEAIFNNVNIVIIAANLNNTSKHLINRSVLHRLAAGALIINPARGEIINEPELIQYLQQNPMAKCYLDVFEQEPFAPGYTSKLTNLNKTSHIAGVFKKLNQDIMKFEKMIIEDFVEYHLSNVANTECRKMYSDCLIDTEQSSQVPLQVL